MRFAAALFLALIFATGAAAESSRRFPHSQITRTEWQAFLAEVKAKPGVRLVDDDRPDTDAYFVKSEQTEYFFTTGGPMHPAVLVVSPAGGNTGRILGYYAGSASAFGAWAKSFGNVGPEFQRALSGH
jgi:hypothetical protein